MPRKINGKWTFQKGEKINEFTVLEPERDEADKILCQCRCGAIRRILARRLGSNPPKNCNDHSKHFVPKRRSEYSPGDRFGRLEIVKVDPVLSTGNIFYYICKCDCGNVKTIQGNQLPSIQSCGCLTTERQKEALGFIIGVNLGTAKGTKALPSNKSTGERNIYYVKSRDEYLVRFQIKGKIVFNKYFKDLEDAKIARDDFRKYEYTELIRLAEKELQEKLKSQD